MDSALAVAIISGICAVAAATAAPVIIERIRRKYKKEDDGNTLTEQIRVIRDDIKALAEQTDKRFEKVETGLNRVTELTDSLIKNEIARTYVNIRRNALKAIKTGKISVKEKEALNAEYARYTRLPNSNGYLKEIMETVSKLQVIVDDDDI